MSETVPILVALWLVVLVPMWLLRNSRVRQTRRVGVFIAGEASSPRLSNVVPLAEVLRFSEPVRPALVPIGGMARIAREKARLRRRNVLWGLACLALITFVGAVIAGGPFVVLHVLVDVLLVCYVGALARRQRLSIERRTKVTHIAEAPGAAFTAPRASVVLPRRQAVQSVRSASP